MSRRSLRAGLAERREVLLLLEDVGDLAAVVRELPADLQRAVPGDDHRLDVVLHVLADPRLDAPEDPVPVERLEAQVVDEDDDPGPRDGKRATAGSTGSRRAREPARRRRRGGRGRRSLSGNRLVAEEDDLAAVDGVEVRQRLEHPVLVDLEVVLRQAPDPVPLRVGHHDVDVRHRDVDVPDEGAGPRRRRRALRRGRQGEGWKGREERGHDGGRRRPGKHHDRILRMPAATAATARPERTAAVPDRARFSGVFRLHFAPRSVRMTASNDGRPGPGGRADVPRGRGKIRRSGLNKPQLGTDAESRERRGARGRGLCPGCSPSSSKTSVGVGPLFARGASR